MLAVVFMIKIFTFFQVYRLSRFWFIFQHTGPSGVTTYEINFTADVYDRQGEALSKSAWLDNQLKKVIH